MTDTSSPFSRPTSPPPTPPSTGTSGVIAIIVAVIGVIGILLPPFINNITTREADFPNIEISTEEPDFQEAKTAITTGGTYAYPIEITNRGNAPATNISVMINAFPMEIVNITNKFSTTDIMLPQFNDTVLKIGLTETINRSLLEIRIPKLVHGTGSLIQLETVIHSSDPEERGKVYAVFDQGSKLGGTLYFGPMTFPEQLNSFWLTWIEPYFTYWIIFFLVYTVLIWYFQRRRKIKLEQEDKESY